MNKISIGLSAGQGFAFLFAWITVAVATIMAWQAGRMQEFWWLLVAELLFFLSGGLTVIKAFFRKI